MKLIPVIFGITIAGSIYGQNLSKYNLHIDFGVNYSLPYERKVELWPEYEDHPITSYKPKSGFTSGAEIEYLLSDYFFIDSPRSKLRGTFSSTKSIID